jgi:hypothetical protein
MRRARILAFLLDILVCAALVDVLGLFGTGAIELWTPLWRRAIPWLWAGAAALAAVAFLLRDVSGGRARRWLALRAIDREGHPPGVRGSVRRNLPLLIPIWNLIEVWPILRRLETERPSDKRSGNRIVSTE